MIGLLLSRPKLIAMAAGAVIVLGMAATIAWQKSSISGLKTNLIALQKSNTELTEQFTKYQADTIKLIAERNSALERVRAAKVREKEIRKDYGNDKTPVAPALADSLDRMQ